MTITRKQKWEEKHLCGRFKRLTSDISHGKTRTRLRKGNLKREIESLLTAAWNNAIRTNHINARIDKTQQNSRCRLCGDRYATINHILSKCSKLAQEYKTRHNWVGKVIHWELYKKLKFDIQTKTIWQPNICPGVWDTNSSWILRFKWITYSLPDDQTLW